MAFAAESVHLVIASISALASHLGLVRAPLRARVTSLPTVQWTTFKHLLDSACATHPLFFHFVVSFFEQLPFDVLSLKVLLGLNTRGLCDVLCHSAQVDLG